MEAGNKSDNFWYKDAVFYELHVRTFYDSNGDGVGDFKGLTAKLEYLQWLGVDCLWLLPFYPSPLKDDGYDVSDFYNIHPDLGTMEDLRAFVQEAHKRGIKVVADLVFNHVSSEHLWFKEARSHPESQKKNWFIWSDTNKKNSSARIIFSDTEKSNWAWDDDVRAYYWHRFYNHQPDLNYDIPEVREEMKNVIRFWLDMGIDGFRCDAVPYLFDREGTNSENLPETHIFFREVRKMLDERYLGRILLAEVNQWPTEVISYFGNNDEFQMLFNFPLMPRIFIALAKEQYQPIADIINQTKNIPEACQWAIFLRNHDELTLEVTNNEERDIMWREYAKHPKMRFNRGIRRRLAPLVDNNRLTIEMLYGLLFSLPGSPVIYYGDELGMGDNIFLGDRNGVRTPMQWSSDKNAGFSSVDSEQLYLPVITNPNYHYEAINVYAEKRLPYSLLNWMKNVIGIRKQKKAFGRGNIELLKPSNTKILAFIREYGDERILCIFNLSRHAQHFELNLEQYAGMIPIEMFGNVNFPAIKKEPYPFTLTGHRFMWFELRKNTNV